MTDPKTIFAFMDSASDPDDAFKGITTVMAYVPNQKDLSTYSIPEGFQNGTVFEALDKPFLARDFK